MLTLPAGTYTVTEPAVPGYSASLANCSNIALTAGSSATCTITNTDIADEPGPGPGLLLTTGTGKSQYLAGETVTLTAQVQLNGTPVPGAQVNFDALKPNGINHVYRSATTDSRPAVLASLASVAIWPVSRKPT